MNPSLHTVASGQQRSYRIFHIMQPHFGTVWHYHPEMELHYVIRGEGIRFIGDNIDYFRAGELILLGANLPHVWHCRENNAEHMTEAVVLQFLPECLGSDFLDLPEAWQLSRLFERARKGILIRGRHKEKIIGLMYEAQTATGLQRIVILLSLLKVLLESADSKSISMTQGFSRPGETECRRLNLVYDYIFSNYKDNITLNQAAAISNMSAANFCRYFKRITHRTYSAFLTEVRVNQACRMLIAGKHAVEFISYECGFNNPANFYRHFKLLKGVTPLEYRQQFSPVKG